MGTTADKLNAILNTKESIKQAIRDKGVYIGDYDAFAEYPDAIRRIETSSGEGDSDEFFNLRTQNGTDFSNLFFSYTGSELDLSGLDTSNVTNMTCMFNNCYSLITLNINNFNTSNVTTMNQMFSSCNALTALNVSSFNTSNVTDMYCMFNSCPNLISLDISNFDTNNVTNMNSMFGGCNALTSLNLSNFNTSNVNDMGYMFGYCGSLTELDLSNFDTSNVNLTDGIFEGCNNLHKLRLDNCSNDTINKIINSVGFPTGQVNVDGEYINRKIYVNPDNIEGLEAPENWKFYNYQTGEEIIDKVEDPFADYSLVIKADDEKLVTDNFGNWSNTTSYFFTGEQLLTLNDFEQVDDCYAIKFEAPIPTFMTIGMNSSTGEPDMASVNSMTELIKFDIDTTIFTFMNCMFLKSIDLSHIDTSGLETISMMFCQCIHLEEIDIRNFDLTHMDATAVDNTFTGCPLHTLRLDNCNTDTINKIINSTGFPTGNTDMFGNPITQERKIYCKEANVAGLTAPSGWSFEFVD